jgi:isopenicillin-N N-acyltransferase-like protein
VDFTKLPIHIALRIALDSTSLSQAVEILRKYGVASACHILLADPTGGIGLEFSHLDLLKIEMENGIVCHSNHFLIPHHPDVNEAVFLPDSKYRIKRVWELVLAAKEKGKREGRLGFEEIGRILEDEGNYPGAINRGKVVETNSETLFSILMDLRERKARVRHGRPTEALEEFELCPA